MMDVALKEFNIIIAVATFALIAGVDELAHQSPEVFIHTPTPRKPLTWDGFDCENTSHRLSHLTPPRYAMPCHAAPSYASPHHAMATRDSLPYPTHTRQYRATPDITASDLTSHDPASPTTPRPQRIPCLATPAPTSPDHTRHRHTLPYLI